MKILVYGFYGHDNLGDDLFEDAFKTIFPELSFTFTDNIEIQHLDNIDAVFFGGGSFLSENPKISSDAFQELLTKKIFYIGIGLETNIHYKHLTLLKIAKVIASRSINNLNFLSILIDDIVFSLKFKLYKKKKNSILYIPNIELIPKRNDPGWKHNAWEYFKCEFSQFMEYILNSGYTLNIAPFCIDKYHHDNWAAYEIINKMEYRNDFHFISDKKSEIIKAVGQHELVISQRYHGLVLSEMLKTPCISIWHHDKLKNYDLLNGKNIPYYGISKNQLIDVFNNASKVWEKESKEKSFDLLKQVVTKKLQEV